jgi:hypothetical protein
VARLDSLIRTKRLGTIVSGAKTERRNEKATAPSRFSTPYSMYPYSEILQPETEHLVALSGTEVKTLKLRRRETYGSN